MTTKKKAKKKKAKLHPETQRLMDGALDILKTGPARTSELLAVLCPGHKVTSNLVLALRRLEKQRKVTIGTRQRGGAMVTLRDGTHQPEPTPTPTPKATVRVKTASAQRPSLDVVINAILDNCDRDMAVTLIVKLVEG